MHLEFHTVQQNIHVQFHPGHLTPGLPQPYHVPPGHLQHVCHQHYYPHQGKLMPVLGYHQKTEIVMLR